MATARGPALDDLIIKKRLRTQTSTIKKNDDTPLKKLAKIYASLCAASETGNAALAQAHYHQFVRELAAFQFQVSRGMTAAAVNMQEEEDYAQLQSRLEASIEAARCLYSLSSCFDTLTKGEIEDLKEELEVARKERQNKEEYEKLRKEAVRHSACTASEAAIADLLADIASLDAESKVTGAEMEERKAKIGQLMQMLDVECLHE